MTVRKTIYQGLVLLMLLTLAGCKDDVSLHDGAAADDQVALTIQVAEDGWTDKDGRQQDSDWLNETIGVTLTRAGETIEQIEKEGFDLFGSGLLGPTSGLVRKVTWDGSKGQWNAGEKIFWKRTTTSSTFNVFAYAPSNSESSMSKYTFDSTSGVLTFKANADDGQNTDLLYASASVDRRDGLARFTFRHALAKISFGTITNSTGTASIKLTKITVKGNLHTEGDLNMTDGTWGNTTTTANKEYKWEEMELDIANGSVKQFGVDPLLLIPGPTATITLHFGSETYSFDTTLEQGKDKTYNIIVEKNFEVVIEQ